MIATTKVMKKPENKNPKKSKKIPKFSTGRCEAAATKIRRNKIKSNQIYIFFILFYFIFGFFDCFVGWRVRGRAPFCPNHLV